jgi:dolichol-phosphate mannosyltransferase
MTTDTERVTVVVPTYNERDNLPKLIGQLLALGMPDLHVLIVDDGSPDGTGDIADKIAEVDAPGIVSVLHRTTKDGLGRAYVAGMTRALAEGADIVIQMDADLSHPAEVVPIMVETLRTTDASVVLGSRYVAGGAVADDWAWHRKILSSWANFYVSAILGMRVKDATAGFKAWKAEALEAIGLDTVQSGGYSFQVELNYRVTKHGLKIAEVPIVFHERTSGTSKMSLGVQVESMLMPWRLRFGKNL